MTERLTTSNAVSAAVMLCSDADTAAGDQLAGTSAAFDTFALIEHRGSWSKNAAEDAVAAAFPGQSEEVASIEGFRPFAIRPIGRAEPALSRLTHIGRVGPAGFLNTVPADAEYDAGALQNLARESAAVSEPLFAVCTNGSRDRCCALKGRPLAQTLHRALADAESSPVFEISHFGGHRFASTMLVLPWGYSYGRLTDELAMEIAYAAQDGLVHPGGLRGRSDLSAPAQAADIIWRTEIGPSPIEAVKITDEFKESGFDFIRAVVGGAQREMRLSWEAGHVVTETLCGGKPFRAGRWTAS